MKLKKWWLCALLLGSISPAGAQGLLGGHVTGSVQIDAQMSSKDSVIGADEVPEKLLLNARADVLYINGPFSAGLRFEMYRPPLLGFEPSLYEGEGIANWFVRYDGEWLTVQGGNIYEQFGNGLILRTYEDRYLGLDNSLLGVSLQLRPVEGVTFKALTGKQRVVWNYGWGLVRGIDGEVALNSVIKAMADSRLRVTLGGGFVSKYEVDESIPAANPEYKLNLPLNVGAGAVRADIAYGGWNLQAEYARKGQDPSELNGYIYHLGEALMLNLSYSQRGFSAQIQGKRIDNMGFKSERTRTGEMLFINYLPAITKNHTYSFMAMYPYATQVNGEQGLQGDVMYKFKKGTLLGGKYGMDIHLNSSVVAALNTDSIGGAGTEGYNVKSGVGDLFYGDASIEVARKLSKDVKLTATYAYQVFNPEVEGHAGAALIHNNIVVADVSWRVNKKHALRMEAEWMGSDSRYAPAEGHSDRRAGDWIMGLVEWNIGSHWFISVSDEYAYHDGIGNYYNLSAGYTHGATRMQVGVGKQREGLLCIGGVCRRVPASNGITFSLTTNF